MRMTPVGEYLRARRQLVHPEDVGMPSGAHRRVPGLRRDEVAALAGISADYYLRLEQGRELHPSQQVLSGLARALLLDAEASAFLRRLATPPWTSAMRGEVDEEQLVRLLEPWQRAAAIVVTGCLDVVAATGLALALAPTAFAPGVNLVEGVFGADTRDFAPDWERLAADTVAALRSGSDPADPRLHALIDGLRRDPDFARLWARHDVRAFTAGTNWFFVDGFGPVELHRQNFLIPGHPGYLIVTTYGAAGTIGEQALQSLARVSVSG